MPQLAALALTSALAAGCVSGVAPDFTWSDHMGRIPFVVGQEQGLRAAKQTGRPPMYYLTAAG